MKHKDSSNCGRSLQYDSKEFYHLFVKLLRILDVVEELQMFVILGTQRLLKNVLSFVTSRYTVREGVLKTLKFALHNVWMSPKRGEEISITHSSYFLFLFWNNAHEKNDPNNILFVKHLL